MNDTESKDYASALLLLYCDQYIINYNVIFLFFSQLLNWFNKPNLACKIEIKLSGSF